MKDYANTNKSSQSQNWKPLSEEEIKIRILNVFAKS